MRRRQGFLTTDVLGAFALLAFTLVASYAVVREVAAAREYSDARRNLRLVAEAELDRLRGAAIPNAARVLPSDASLRFASAPGSGDWDGWRVVTVIAEQPMRGGRTVRVRLSAYLPAGAESP